LEALIRHIAAASDSLTLAPARGNAERSWGSLSEKHPILSKEINPYAYIA
jgi:hypothetical protein